MKILTPVIAGWVGQVTCKRCGADLEVDAKDLHITYGEEDYQGPEWYNADVSCPLCANFIKVEVPNQTLRALYWQEKKRVSLTDMYYDK